MILNPVKFCRHAHKLFSIGPDWVVLPKHLRKREGYKSPTLMLMVWSYAWYIRLFTVPGRMLMSSIFLVSLYGALKSGPIRIFAFILLGVLIIDLIFGMLFRPKLKLTREIPERARAGTPIKITYKIQNLRFVPAWNIHLDPVHQQNWLKLEEDVASLDVILGKEELEVSAPLLVDKRGEYVLKPPFASSGFPFGIIKWTCRTGIAQRVLVHPAYEPLTSLNLPLNSRFQREGTSLVSNVGESLEFHACREFRMGDNPKHIHWPTSARRGELIVREFHEEYLCRIALVVDTFVPLRKKTLLSPVTWDPEPTTPEFEAALSLTAALADHLARGDYIVDVFAAGPNIYHFKGGRSLAQLEQILDILSCIEPNGKEPLTKLESAVMEEIAGIGSAVLLLLKWDDDREQLVENIRSRGVNLKIIVISDDPATPVGGDVARYAPNDIMSGNVREL
ncbi:MAG: DUF58 domain-containing protein [Kiritimatiellaeota bacterium]|nr:DUF58 domain-containing protein [Kiritimatiellota bacterium]